MSAATVLIVDHAPDSLAVAGRLLRDAGHEKWNGDGYPGTPAARLMAAMQPTAHD